MKRLDARSVADGVRRRRGPFHTGLLATLVAALASSCDSSLEARLERRVDRELQRFPGSLEFTNAEHPGSRAFHPDLAALAPLIGKGVEIPDKSPRPDGATNCKRWGWWTYHYVVAKPDVGPDGKTRWSFQGSEPPLGLEAEGEYEANEPNGPWSFWHPNGQLRAQGSFVKGSVEGPWTFWSDTGVVDATKSGEYAAGKLVKPASAGSAAR